MQYTIEILSGYLKAEMVERETALETAEFALSSGGSEPVL